jgi:hypothetical protein
MADMRPDAGLVSGAPKSDDLRQNHQLVGVVGEAIVGTHTVIGFAPGVVGRDIVGYCFVAIEADTDAKVGSAFCDRDRVAEG